MYSLDATSRAYQGNEGIRLFQADVVEVERRGVKSTDTKKPNLKRLGINYLHRHPLPRKALPVQKPSRSPGSRYLPTLYAFPRALWVST
jgi:hypothetical protein